MAGHDGVSVKVVGLTGGIGCGKSAASAMFAALGIVVVDTDEIARQLTAVGGNANYAIAAEFGTIMLGDNGAMDREKMRGLVFDNPTARHQLETILHPMIFECSRQALAEIGVGSPYAILAIPLLFERRTFIPILWRTLAIDCPLDTQLTRVNDRSGLDRDDTMKIVGTQVPRAIRLQLADDVINNNGTISELRLQVGKIHGRYLQAIGNCPEGGWRT